MSETSHEGRRCAYELCKSRDPITVIGGHRTRRYHDENCRQAQHRLLQQRARLADLRQLWADFLPATQQVLEEALSQGLGEHTTRSVATAIAHERDQARRPGLTEAEHAEMQAFYAGLQSLTRNLLDALFSQPLQPLSAAHLILRAIREEQRHASCNSELEQRVAYLDIQLAEYRRIIDLENREKLQRQFMAVGQLLGYRTLRQYNVGEGPDRWEDYASWTHEDTLAEIIVYGREVLAEEEAARERAQEKSQLRQVEHQLAQERARQEDLEQVVKQERARREKLEHEGTDEATLTDQQRTVQLTKDLAAVRIGAASSELCQTLYGQALLLVKECEREVQYLKTRIDKQLERRIAKQQKRIAELEAERAEWLAWKEAEVRESGGLTAMREYLQEHIEASIPIKRNGVTVRVMALGADAVAVTEDHGVIRLSDEELEQGRIWVCKKVGVPIIATWLPIGESRAEGQRRLQLERELDAAQSEIQALHRDLAKHLPPPRELLEAALRRWCALTKVFFQDEPLAGEELDVFIQESSDQRLLKFIETGEACYFIGKHRRRRIVLIQQHLSQVEPYRGDPTLALQSIDEQGYVTFASGDRHWMDTNAIEQFWSRIVGSKGQQHVGGNTNVAMLQWYLCDHPGQSIPVRRGADVYEVVVVDDDGLAVTTLRRPLKLYEDDIEQAQRWVEQQS